MIIKSAEYIEFENGFLKEAEAYGCDVDFLRGYIKQADEMVDILKEAFDELAEKSGDPLYRYKLAQELMYISMVNSGLQKKADLSSMTGSIQNALSSANGQMGNWQNQLSTYANSPAHQQGMMGGIMKWLGPMLKNNPNMLSNLMSGGAGGGLLGLLIGALTGHPFIGAGLGALGGAGLSAFNSGNNMMQAAQSIDSFGNKDPNQQAPSDNQTDALSAGSGPVKEPNTALPIPGANNAIPSSSPQSSPSPAASPVAPPTGHPAVPGQLPKPKITG